MYEILEKLPQPAATAPLGSLSGALARLFAALALVLLVAWPGAASAQSRIKDVAEFEGVRDNLLVGYGLVVGLNGTALGDASSLLGGTLLVTPLLAADGEVYAVAQGPIAVAGFSAAGNAQTITRGVPTSGRIPNGAIIERELDFELNRLNSIKVSLHNPDLTTARRIARAINAFVGQNAARSTDPGTVSVRVPQRYRGDTVAMLTDIEQLRVQTDQSAKVVIDERSGVIVMGENVRISTVAIAQGNLTIRITETPQVSQPNAFSNTGETEVVDRTNIEVDEDSDNRLAVLDSGISLQELVNGLNALGVGPRDMITILQAIKTAGALQADIEVL